LPAYGPEACPPFRHRTRFGAIATLICLTTSLSAQLAEPPQNVNVDAYDRGLIIHFDRHDGSLRVSKYQYTRDGGDPVELFSPPIVDSPLEPSTTYEYQIWGIDFAGAKVTETATISATTRPAGEGITTTRLTRENGIGLTNQSAEPVVSSDGRFVAFITRAEELVGQSGSREQIVLLDRESGQFSTVSQNGADLANDDCFSPAISADGRSVVFISEATNLGSFDTPSGGVFLFDRESGLLTLVSKSADGNGPNRKCEFAAISDDGSTVAYVTNATNLIAGSTDDRTHAYVADLDTGEVVRLTTDGVSGSPNHTEFLKAYEVGLNGDGSLVAYRAAYKNNFQTTSISGQWLYDRASGETTVITALPSGRPADGVTAGAADLTPDGRYVVFYYRVLVTKSNQQILSGVGAWGTIYLLDRVTGIYEFVAGRLLFNSNSFVFPAPTAQYPPTISDDGRIVTFGGGMEFGFGQDSSPDVFIRDRSLNRTVQASRSSLGNDGEGFSESAVVSGDGSVIIYQSRANNLVENDTSLSYADLFATELSLDPPDSNPPIWPQGNAVEITNLGATLADISWPAAVDPEGSLAGYRVHLDGDLISTTTSATQEASISNLLPETAYSVKVEAFDAAGNASTDGPEIKFTTKSLVIGGAGLTGTALEGGRVTLSWDPAEGSIAGYTIQRRIDDTTDWVEIEEVSGNTLTYTDAELPASTDLAYRILVRLIGETEKSVHSTTQTVSTPALFISQFDIDIPHESKSLRVLPLSGTFGFQLIGERERSASVEIDYQIWPDPIGPESEPATMSTALPLNELVDQLGTYIATWSIPDRLVEVTRVSATLKDNHDGELLETSAAFPRPVGAGFSVEVIVDESLPHKSSDITVSAWSEAQLAGRSQVIGGDVTIAETGLPPGEDYRLRFFWRGQSIREETMPGLKAGLVTELEPVKLARVQPTFKVSDPEGQPPERAVITVFDPETDSVIGQAETDTEGIAILNTENLALPPGKEIKYVVSKLTWDLAEIEGVAALPPDGTPIQLNLPWSDAYIPPGVVTGSVRFDGGSPAPDAKVTFTSLEPGVFSKTDVQTDSEGRFSSDEVYGLSGMVVTNQKSQSQYASTNLQVTANADSPVNVDVVLKTLETYTVIVEAIELIDSVGTVQRFRPYEAPHLTRLLGMSVVRTGESFADRVKDVGDGNLSIETRMAKGTEFTLFVDGDRLGYSPGSVVLTSGEAHTIRVDLIQLRMDQDDFLFGQLVGPDDKPVHARFPWIASMRYSGGWTVQSDRFFGFGPSVVLPRSVAAAYNLEFATADRTSFPVLGQTVRVDGPSGPIDLGSIRFREPGRFASGSRFKASPNLVIPGQTVIVELHPYNGGDSPVYNAVVNLPLPEGVSYEPQSLAVNGEPVTPLEVEGGMVIQMPSKTAYPELDLPLIPEGADVFGRGLITRSEFRLRVGEDFDLSRLDLTATITYEAGDGAVTETIGVANLDVIYAPTLTGPKVVTGSEIVLKGRSRAGRIIIMDGETPIDQTEVSKAGYWSLSSELTTPQTPYWHSLHARWIDPDSGEERVSPYIEVLRSPFVVRPVRVRIRQPVEEANTPEEIALVKRWEDVGTWTEFEVPESGPATFWKRILAGFPFQVEVEFNKPDDVRDVSVQIAGAAGGSGNAVRGDDGVYRARIESRRNVEWDAGEITVTYTPLGNAKFPKWGNTIRIGTDIVLLGEETSPSISSESTPLQTAGTDFGYRANASIGTDFTATVEARFRAGQPLPAEPVTTIDYPYGNIAAGTSSVGSVGGSVSWSISGSTISVNASFSVAAAEFVKRDKIAPYFPEDASLGVLSATDSSMTIGWSQALDDTWIETYAVSIGNEVIAEVEGDQLEVGLPDLEPGQTYEISVEAKDAADKTTGAPLQASVEFSGASTQIVRPGRPIASAQHPQIPIVVEPPRAASAGGLVKVSTYIGGATTGVGVLNWYNGVESSEDRFDRWDDQLEKLDECGASPGDLANIKNEMDQATEAVVVENITSTVMTTVSVGAAFTGAGLPLSVGIEVAGVALGYMLGNASEEETREVEVALSEALKECEDDEEEDCPPGIDDCDDDDGPAPTRSPVADPTWKIDPSGYVYEVNDDNRLAGVTATLLEGGSENGPWTVSDAEAFGEINPQVTSTGGVYRWDVPKGWWQVMYEKEGYETAYSDVLPVPPPHFDVNIPMKSLARPQVISVESLNNGAALRVDFANYVRAAMVSADTIRLRDSEDQLLEGRVFSPAESLVDNPHTEETAEIEVTITDQLSGTYFGSFDPGGGPWSLRIEEDRSIALEGYDPETDRLFAVDGTIDVNGELSLDLGELATGAVLTGTVIDGEVSGLVSVLDYALEGVRSQGEAAAESDALTYHGAVIGSKETTVTATLGPDGTVLAIIDGELAATAATTKIDGQGTFSKLLSDGSELILDLSDAEGAMSGVLSLVDSGSWEVLGAAEGSPKARLVNVSGRGPVASGNGSLIAGFVTRGTSESPMLVRAIGPGLETFGVTGVLEQPRIRLVDQSMPVDSNLVAENTNWLQAGNRNELRAVFAGLGAFFLEDAKTDATVYVTIQPGPYTAVVQGVDGQAGIVLVEAYDADLGVFGTTSGGVANLSLRGNVGSGAGVMIAGFVIEGNAPRRLLLRGVGPGLGPLGVTGFLENPQITLYQGEAPISDNQSWGEFLANEGLVPIFQTVGAFDLEPGSDDAAIVLWMAPGAYTLHLSNEVDGGGVGLIEIYDLP
jgi:Tol biopolymer transport system component